jgi:hypothetical protein
MVILNAITPPMHCKRLPSKTYIASPVSRQLRSLAQVLLEKTSTKQTPWFLVPSNDKRYGRLAVFTVLVELLGKGIRLKPRPLDPKIADMARQLFDLPS